MQAVSNIQLLALIVQVNPSTCTMNFLSLRKPNKCSRSLRHTANSGIVADYCHAAGALIFVELSVGSAQSLSDSTGHVDVEAGIVAAGSLLGRILPAKSHDGPCALRS